MKLGKIVACVGAVSMVLSGATAVAQTTISGTTKVNNDTWNQAGNWDAGVPSGAIDAIVAAGITAECRYTNTPAYSGTLTLNAGSTLKASADLRLGAEYASGTNSFSASSITMEAGSVLSIAFYQISDIHLPPIVLNGDAQITPAANWADHSSRSFDGAISGTGQLTFVGRNNMTYNLNVANSFSGNFIATGLSNWRVDGEATGAFGTGDVTINDTVTLRINAADSIADSATLSLVGAGDTKLPSPYYKLYMNAADTVNLLVVDGFPRPTGTYGKVGSGADHEVAWIGGNSLLTVSSQPVDSTAPTVSFADSLGGAAVMVGQPLVYTITFDEPTTPALVAADLENAGSSSITGVSVTQTDELTYSVELTATSVGTLQLGIKSGAPITDLFGNPLVTPVADNDTITVADPPLLKGQFGCWVPWVNDGINPATGQPWALGDKYHLAFVSGGTRDATSPDDFAYHAFVQAAADAVGWGEATWYAVVACYNDAENPDYNGARDANVPAMTSSYLIVRPDGVKLADNGADLANGPDNGFNITETVGEYHDRVATGAGRMLGDPGQTNCENGDSDRTNSTTWWRVYNQKMTDQAHFYAISDELTVQSAAPSGTQIILK